MASPKAREGSMAQPTFIGRVIEASARAFWVGGRLTAEDIPAFGSFVQTARGETTIIGVIYDIVIEGDDLTRMIALQDVPPQEIQQDVVENRNLPVQIGVLTLGSMRGLSAVYGIPHQPPALLEPVYTCSPSQVRRFTEQPDFLRILVEAREASDDVLAAVLRTAAAVRPGPGQRDFLVRMGQELVRQLADEPIRLGQILRRIRAAVGTLPEPS